MNKLFDITGYVTVITGGTGVLGRAISDILHLKEPRSLSSDERKMSAIQSPQEL